MIDNISKLQVSNGRSRHSYVRNLKPARALALPFVPTSTGRPTSKKTIMGLENQLFGAAAGTRRSLGAYQAEAGSPKRGRVAVSHPIMRQRLSGDMCLIRDV